MDMRERGLWPFGPKRKNTDEGEGGIDPNVRFGLQHNGYISVNGGWRIDRERMRADCNRYTAQWVSFFGPDEKRDFYSLKSFDRTHIPLFETPSVRELIQTYRVTKPELAGRLSYLLGGLIREKENNPGANEQSLSNAVDFMAGISTLGKAKSVEAIASSIAMYILSGGSLERDARFTTGVMRMAAAIEHDPIIPERTEHLGLSQVARLRRFFNGEGKQPNIAGHMASLTDFPTLGAEFHLPITIAEESPDIWKRLALANMSQYQRDSYIQLSRKDRGILEVRMNPSVFPITLANVNYLRLLLPELQSASFTLTLDRGSEHGNFSWKNFEDTKELTLLHRLGLLLYASSFEDVPLRLQAGEIQFGSMYLGQTESVSAGMHRLRGDWRGGKGVAGQVGLYVGYGDTFSEFASYLSMGLAKPSLLRPLTKPPFDQIATLQQALDVSDRRRKALFAQICDEVTNDTKLQKAAYASASLIDALKPFA